MSIFLTVFTGVATGLAASALLWWLQAKLLRPKIVICPDLRLTGAEEEDSSTHLSCEFKIVNRRRFAAADISIKANLALSGLLGDGSRYIFYMRDLTLAWMEPGRTTNISLGQSIFGEKMISRNIAIDWSVCKANLLVN
jgi:hypothetical protein